MISKLSKYNADWPLKCSAIAFFETTLPLLFNKNKKSANSVLVISISTSLTDTFFDDKSILISLCLMMLLP